MQGQLNFVPGKVSVLMPCYQHGHILNQSLDSIFAQSYPNYHLIIINDGSTDATEAVVQEYQQKYPGLISYIYQTNQGQVIARSRGSTLIEGEFLILLDADDLLAPDMMARCVENLQNDPAAAAVAGDVWSLSEDGKKNMTKLDQSLVPTWPNILTLNSWGGIAGIMIRSSSLQQVGWFDFLDRPGGEDWDIWIRFARANMKLNHIPLALAYYRQSHSSHSRKAIKVLKGVLDVLETLTRPDSRLANLNNVHPPIDQLFYNWLRNKTVIFNFGVGTGSQENVAVLEETLSYLVPLELDLPVLANAYVNGVKFAILGQKKILFSKALHSASLKVLGEYITENVSAEVAQSLCSQIENNLAKYRDRSNIITRIIKFISNKLKMT
jgi:glycosyltransferase involved in cell wall biosynthesis